MKKYLKWIICAVSIILFIIVSLLVFTKSDIYIDSVVYKYVSKYISDNNTNFIKILTYLGSGIVVISITLFALIFIKNKKYALYMSIDLLLITIFQLMLKNIFARNRPIDINLIDENGYSFPSGHSLTCFAFYGFIIYLIYISGINKKIKIIFITLLSFVILFVGLSRIYLGVHYFTDVIGGFLFSLAYLIIFTTIIKKQIN